MAFRLLDSLVCGLAGSGSWSAGVVLCPKVMIRGGGRGEVRRRNFVGFTKDVGCMGYRRKATGIQLQI